MEENEMKFIDFFNEIEKKYPVCQWKMNDVDVWPILRIQLGFNININENPKSNNIKIEENSIGKLPVLTELLNKGENVDVIILFDSLSRIKLGDSWYHRLAGPFDEEIRKMGMNVVNLEFSNHNIERFPVYDESYSITNQIKYINENTTYYLNTGIELEKYNEVKKEFISTFGENLHFPTLQSLNKITYNIRKLSYIFELIFIKKKTKVAFVVNYYQHYSYALILAARRVGIPAVDIQHGVQLDIFYHKWVNIPKCGYNILPDYFWCWEKKDADVINKWAKETNKHKALNGGNPWIELWKDDKQVIVKQYARITNTFIDRSKVNILLTLQPLYSLKNWSKNIPDWVIRAIDTSPDNWKWYIRYHPQMLGNYINEKKECEEALSEYIENGKVEVENSSKLPLMALLRAMTVHVTAFSTSVIEGKYVQVPSITLHPRAESFFVNEYSSGWATKAYETEDLINNIKKYVTNMKEEKLKNQKLTSIGLSKGISLILNREKGAYVSNINESMAKIEVFFADKQYKKVINEYEQDPFKRVNFIVGKAYEELKKVKKAFSFYENYLNDLLTVTNNYNSPLINMKELILIKEFYQKQSKGREIDNLTDIIFRIINLYDNIKSIFFFVLFQSREYSEIKSWGNLVKHNMDTKYFLGRALLKLGETIKGIEILEDYLNQYRSNEINDTHLITLEKNYQVSAHFYLGEAFISQNKYREAKEHFHICNILLNGHHRKATEYLNLLSLYTEV